MPYCHCAAITGQANMVGHRHASHATPAVRPTVWRYAAATPARFKAIHASWPLRHRRRQPPLSRSQPIGSHQLEGLRPLPATKQLFAMPTAAAVHPRRHWLALTRQPAASVPYQAAAVQLPNWLAGLVWHGLALVPCQFAGCLPAPAAMPWRHYHTHRHAHSYAGYLLTPYRWRLPPYRYTPYTAMPAIIRQLVCPCHPSNQQITNNHTPTVSHSTPLRTRRPPTNNSPPASPPPHPPPPRHAIE